MVCYTFLKRPEPMKLVLGWLVDDGLGFLAAVDEEPVCVGKAEEGVVVIWEVPPPPFVANCFIDDDAFGEPR